MTEEKILLKNVKCIGDDGVESDFYELKWDRATTIPFLSKLMIY